MIMQLVFLKRIFANNDNCLFHGTWLHMRCSAHILNLVIQDRIKNLDKSIKNIRCEIKWIKNSNSRLDNFTIYIITLQEE